jgi:membrane-bound lytic murein transglycosylase D
MPFATLALLGAALPAGASYHEAVDPGFFPVAESLAPAVQFWVAVFGEHSSDHVVIHDDRHLDIVYSVVDLSGISGIELSEFQQERERRARVRDEVRRIEDILRHLSGQSVAGVNLADAQRIEALFERLPGGDSKYRSAMRRIRPQTGQRDKFAEAIRVSGMFMDRIEAILEQGGVPIEISRLPFIESMFNYKARSKVGASGAWQFTADSARPYMMLDTAVDARSDVLLAAEGAAKKLAREFDDLGTWPLTLTGYNHGHYGMKRAVRALGTTAIEEIVERYDGRAFGFASRNFYVEFVAALIVYADREQMFPDVTPLPPLSFDEFRPGRFVSLLDLAKLVQIELLALQELNPALSHGVLQGHLLVPSEYPLRIPLGTLPSFNSAFGLLPDERKAERQLATRYTVRSGDTLGRIAERFGLSLRTIQQANGLSRPDRLHIGQVLEIPNRGNWGPLPSSPVRVAASLPPSGGMHRVGSGETLSSIAGRYGVSITALVEVNNLSSQHRIIAGQELRIPDGSARSHRVLRGESLARIATKYGVSVSDLMATNELRTTIIHPGQVLKLPL